MVNNCSGLSMLTLKDTLSTLKETLSTLKETLSTLKTDFCDRLRIKF